MMMGNKSKQESANELRLERKILGRRDRIILKRELCNGCGICAEVCPKDSVSLKPAVTENGRLLHFPVVDIYVNTCILCGVCAFFCSLNALEAWVDDEKTAMFVKTGALPQPVKIIEVTKEMCKPDCGLECEKNCPRNAIKVKIQKTNGQIKEIIDVQIDRDLCFYCKVCEYACPYEAIGVEKFMEGSVAVETEKCPQGCQICMDVCSTKAITSEKGKVEVSSEICIYCKACQNVCPEKTINVTVNHISHTPITSALWTTLLERFASYETAMK